MSALTKEEEDLLIIMLVQEYPHIYDKRNPDYANKETRELSFEIISESVGISRKLNIINNTLINKLTLFHICHNNYIFE